MYGIFTYIWLIFMVNVGKYTSPMDPMGKGYLWELPYSEHEPPQLAGQISSLSPRPGIVSGIAWGIP